MWISSIMKESQKSLIKDAVNFVLLKRTRTYSTMILALSEVPSIFVEHSDRQGGDVGTIMYFKMGKQLDGPDISSQREGTSSTSTLASAYTLELLGISYMPLRPSIIVPTIGFIVVPQKVLQHLVKIQDFITTYLEHVQTKLASLYMQILPWVQMKLENGKARLRATL